MKNNKKVSIIMPAHNASKYISQSIESVISQVYNDWELIVVNDRSTDGTRDIVKNFERKDCRIVLLDNTSSIGGAYYARNIAIEKATGKYIAFLDSDDLWLPNKLSSQISIMSLKGYYASHCSYIRVDKDSEHLNNVNVMDIVTYQDQLKSNRIPNLTGIYDRSNVDVVMQSNVGHEDYDMWLKILRQTHSIGINKPLAHYRVLSDSLSSNKIKAAAWHYNILRQQTGIGFFKRSYYFLVYIYNAISKRV